MGIGLIYIDAKDCMMLKAHQSLSNKELSLRNKTVVDFYIGVIKLLPRGTSQTPNPHSCRCLLLYKYIC